MKKLLPLIAACLLITAGFATPSASTQPVSVHQPQYGEPEPHPNNLYVKLKVNGQTTILWLLAFPDDTIGEVKSSVEDMVGFSINYLSYQGQILNESATLAFYGIGANATLNAY